MKDIIKISWDSGYYALIPEKFFPTTMKKTRKIFKLMLSDPSWGDAEIKELLQYFQERRDRAVKSAAENRAMSKATMELSQRVLLQCRNRNDPKYKEYMGYRDKAKELEREAKHCMSEVGYFNAAKSLLLDMVGGRVT